MKQALTKLFRKESIEPILVGLGSFVLLTFIIFPGLISTSTFKNISAGFGGIILLMFLYYYIFNNDTKKINDDDFCEAGETELDYIPEEELKVKNKRTVVPKQSVKKIKPLTEGRIKSQIKQYDGELPITQAPPPPKPPKLK